MVLFNSLLRSLDTLGLLDVLLPFFLIFTIIFAIFQKAHIFGKDDKTYNVIISIIFGLVVVIPHILGRYPAGADIVDILNSALPNVAAVLIFLIFFILIVGVFGGSPKWTSGFGGIIAIISFIVVGGIFASSAGLFRNNYFNLNFLDANTQALLIVILVFLFIIWFITRKPGPSNAGDVIKKGITSIGDAFKPGG